MLKNFFCVVAACFVIVMAVGCAENAESSEESEYSYAALSERVEVFDKYAQIDVYYNDICESSDYGHYMGKQPFISIRETDTGRVCDTVAIPTAMVGEDGTVITPEKLELKLFEVQGHYIFAVLLDYDGNNGEPHFFHYCYDNYEGMYLISENYTLPFDISKPDWASLSVDGNCLTDGSGGYFEFNFSDYPTTVTFTEKR